ncbi:MAG: cyclic nucleotide-binding domain-containing protein, partial [Thermostichales cyanobacterium BF3_bins_165]
MTFSLDRVRGHFLFQTLTDEEWASLTRVLRLQRYQPAQVIFAEGDSSRDLLLLLTGTVELRRQFIRHPGDYLLATLQPGQLLGEMSLLSGYRRSATAVALSEVEAAVLSPAALDSLPPSLQAKLYRACA